MNLGHTNIRSTPGFLVIVQVNCYLVEIQASQCLVPLSGRNPGFTMFHTIIWSNPGFMVSCTAIWSIPGFTIPYFLSGRIPGFRRNQVVIQSHPGFHLILRPTNIRSTPGFIVIGRVDCYLVEIQASQCPLLLSGRNPGFSVFYRYLVVIQASRCLIPLSGRIQASWCSEKSRYYPVESGLHNLH